MPATIVSLALLAASLLGLAAAPVAAAASGPKVVLIVGPTEGTTSSYRSTADAAATEARKYTSNVVKVYSPNATWAKVKAAVVGASVVVYLGHGNGWPSPYPYDPDFSSRDGFGLNKTAGNGDSNHTYYGETYVKTMDLAPNAVIILNHLCYASGSSEPGRAAPTLTIAKQRVDNFGAGFLAGKASAVIAEGIGSAASEIRALFTHSGSIVDAWKSSSSANGHVSSFASTRTSGATAYMDPDTATTGFHRSLVTKPKVTTAMILAGEAAPPQPYGDTPFVDIAASSFRNDIAWLFASGITAGCAADAYCPERTVTRGEMASFLARAMDLPSSSVDAFSDDDGNSHEADIDRLAAAGIATSCGSGHYCPDSSLSRAEMATFLSRALDLPASSTDAFTDDDSSPNEADIDRLAAADLTSGCGPTTYCPTASVTRGQMAAFLHRAFPAAHA